MILPATHTISDRLYMRKITSAILVFVLAASAAGCSATNTVQSETTAVSSEVTETSEETTATTTAKPTEPPEVYDFTWGEEEEELFGVFLREYLGCELTTYISRFGYTYELNMHLTEFVNRYYDTEYKSVPFSEVGYFEKTPSETALNWYKNNPDNAKKYLFDSKKPTNGILTNKVLYSYLVQNKIPFGTRIPMYNLRTIAGDEIYTIDTNTYFNKNFSKSKFDGSEKYTGKCLCAILLMYNSSIPDLAASDSGAELLNGFMKDHYGDKALKAGEILTGEKYKELFESEPIDLSYIPMNLKYNTDTEVKPAELDKSLKGSWARVNNYFLSQTFKFNGDGTGVLSSRVKGQLYNADTKKNSKTKTNTTEFTYTNISKKIIRITYASGEKRTWVYKIKDKGKVLSLGSFGQFKKK